MWQIPALAVVLFGSVARGQAGPTSDVDLLVVHADATEMDAPGWRHQLGELAENVTAMTGNDARVLEYSAAEISSRGRLEGVVASAMTEGIPLFGSIDRLRRRDTTSRRKT